MGRRHGGKAVRGVIEARSHVALGVTTARAVLFIGCNETTEPTTGLMAMSDATSGSFAVRCACHALFRRR